MVYHSLFDKIIQLDTNFINSSAQQVFFGRLDDLLWETKKKLSISKYDSESGWDCNDNERDYSHLALHPPRIIRSIMDSKIETLDDVKIEPLLRDSIQLGLKIYSGGDSIVEDIVRLRKNIIDTGNKALLNNFVMQDFDCITWEATSPLKSEKTTKHLIYRTAGKPILFTALGHGGVAAGMDVFLRYCDKTKTVSDFYAARFSRSKHGDDFPQLNSREIEYLQSQLQGKKLVLFDEDRSTGRTLNIAKQFFESRVFPKKRVLVETNLDDR